MHAPKLTNKLHVGLCDDRHLGNDHCSTSTLVKAKKRKYIRTFTIVMPSVSNAAVILVAIRVLLW